MTSHRFPTLEDFPIDVLDVRADASPEACHRLGDYRLAQVSNLIERLRHERNAGASGQLRQEVLLSAMEALLMDAHLMYARAHGRAGSKA
ncbi:hypothetical protein ID144_11740 [Pseudomonas sp. JM0905a]|uniref:hypothetical protein n=1 Tax=Pseudomonas sp. JM0905a TaxID=2772484 RepID=UPI0016848107|nr:hypothetical protein [Pseudomonas sp. JM0905a]MBD2837715.1 hypothetical protein [Pseudomonas sp. JM0905a]